MTDDEDEVPEDEEEDDGAPVQDFVSVIRRQDGSIYVDHNGDEDVALALLARGTFFLISPAIEEAEA